MRHEEKMTVLAMTVITVIKLTKRYGQKVVEFHGISIIALRSHVPLISHYGLSIHAFQNETKIQ